MTENNDRKLKFEEVLEGISPEHVYKAVRGGKKHFAMRVTPPEKESIERMAQAFDITATDYLLRLHRMACDRMIALEPFFTEQIRKRVPLPRDASEEDLLEVVIESYRGEDGKNYPITRLQMLGHSWRRFAVAMLKAVSPVDYEEYKRLKYGKMNNPDLETRRKAYGFAVQKFLELTYTVPGY